MGFRERFQTEWAGKLGLACELARRNYLVSWPLGNAPVMDLMCQSPQGQTFRIQVKSFRQRGYLPIGAELVEEVQDLWFVFVYVPKNEEEGLEYFILPQQRLMHIREQEKQDAQIKSQERVDRGLRPYGKWPPGVYYNNIKDFKSRWDTLPA